MKPEGLDPEDSFWYKFPNKLWHFSILILIIGVIMLAPYLLTRQEIISGLNFSETGQIGDTIGGITAPMIGLLAAFLVFVSFKAQVRANIDQRKALLDEIHRNRKKDNFNTLYSLFNRIQDDFNRNNSYQRLKKFAKNFESDISIRLTVKQYKYTDSDLENLSEGKFVFGEFILSLNLLELILDKMQSAELENMDRKLLVQIFAIFYQNQLSEYLNNILKNYNRFGLKEPFPSSKKKLIDISTRTQLKFVKIAQDLGDDVI